MREHKIGSDGRRRKRINIILWWVGWHRLSTNYRERKLYPTRYIHSHDGSSWFDELNIPITWLSYKVAITTVSITTFTVGIGQLIIKLMGKG